MDPNRLPEGIRGMSFKDVVADPKPEQVGVSGGFIFIKFSSICWTSFLVSFILLVVVLMKLMLWWLLTVGLLPQNSVEHQSKTAQSLQKQLTFTLWSTGWNSHVMFLLTCSELKVNMKVNLARAGTTVITGSAHLKVTPCSYKWGKKLSPCFQRPMLLSSFPTLGVPQGSTTFANQQWKMETQNTSSFAVS